ncbi:hypothetical protein P8C59_008185 [Phyllachora maydis]|uniref:MIP18 family-like domain-containing protein n=1 Tax=Phyllachora maydis TaxID=1825666 RepID=A0AAD9IA70_9PEZI|nr:hypothetical protein P8C59_008185 [Phyllachora maydis]
MQRDGLDNANPTILSQAQLPTRRRGAQEGSVRRVESKFDHILFPRATSWSLSDQEAEEASDGDLEEEPIDELEIYDLISTISDPEHPHTLGQLSVVNLPDIHMAPKPAAGQRVDLNALSTVLVELTPTINHCSLATVIGLAVRVRLERALPPNFRVDVRMKAGSHAQDDQVNKQLSDKERVAAALENDTLRRYEVFGGKLPITAGVLLIIHDALMMRPPQNRHHR